MTKSLRQTGSQTAGPYLHIGLLPSTIGIALPRGDLGCDIGGPNARGARIRIEGRVFDGDGVPMTDALIEVWQANADGVYGGGGAVEDGFRGWGRVMTDFDTGAFAIDTIKPGASGPHAPQIALWVIARGINQGLSTRLYFDDETAANASDPVLNLIDPAARRDTLIAKRQEGTPSVYRFDIHIQGEDETVFFDI